MRVSHLIWSTRRAVVPARPGRRGQLGPAAARRHGAAGGDGGGGALVRRPAAAAAHPPANSDPARRPRLARAADDRTSQLAALRRPVALARLDDVLAAVAGAPGAPPHGRLGAVDGAGLPAKAGRPSGATPGSTGRPSGATPGSAGRPSRMSPGSAGRPSGVAPCSTGRPSRAPPRSTRRMCCASMMTWPPRFDGGRTDGPSTPTRPIPAAARWSQPTSPAAGQRGGAGPDLVRRDSRRRSCSLNLRSGRCWPLDSCRIALTEDT